MTDYEKKKEIHLYLDANEEMLRQDEIETTFKRCIEELSEKYGKHDILKTTLPCFLSFKYGKRLFVHLKGQKHEIREGVCEGTDKDIRISSNVEKMLLSGSFEYFKDYDEVL